MERVPVVLGLTPVAERSVEHLLFGRDAVLEPLAGAADADDLERTVFEADTAAVLLSSDLAGLTSGHCARIRATGVGVIGLAKDSWERQRLRAFGVDDVLGPEDPEEAFLAALGGPTAAEIDTSTRGGSEELLTARFEQEDRGSVLAVIGSKGAPGASECAASLAALAGERWLAVRDGWPPVLLGAPDPVRALSELAHPGSVAGALRALAAAHALVVADVGFLLAEGQDAGPACRFHREAVVGADVVVLVLGAREEQLRAGFDQLDTPLALGIPPERLRVTVNGVRGSGAVRASALESVVYRQLAERRFALDAWLPWDGRALARARRTGLPLARARSRGTYARALSQLLGELFLPFAPAPRDRKLRLTPPQPHEEVPGEVAAWRS